MANLVWFIVLKKPTNLKSPIALKKKIIAITKTPYRKYFLLIYLSNNPRFTSVINANNSNPQATIKPGVIAGFNLIDPLELVGKTSKTQSCPPKAQ